MVANSTAFPVLNRCECCGGSGGPDQFDECRACQGTGGAQCVICREPSPEVASNGVCEWCTSGEGLAELLDADCPAVSDPRIPSPVEAYEDVVRLRMAWAARREWVAYRFEQAAQAAEFKARAPVAAWDESIPF